MEDCTYFENNQSLYLLYRSHKSSPHRLKTQRSNMVTQQRTPHTALTNTHSLWYKTHKGNRDGKFCASFVVHSNYSSSWNRTHVHVHLPSGRGSARARRQRRLTGEAEGPRQRSLREMVCVRSSHPERWLHHLHHLQPVDDRLLPAAWRWAKPFLSVRRVRRVPLEPDLPRAHLLDLPIEARRKAS